MVTSFETAESYTEAERLESGVKRSQDVDRLGAHAEVCMSLGEGDDVLPVDDEGGRQGEPPALFGSALVVESGVVEGDVDEDRLIVAALFGSDGVGNSELVGNTAACIGEKRERETVLVEHEGILPGSLWRDGDEESAAPAKLGVELAPRLEFSDAVRAPSSAEEFENDCADGYEIGGLDGFAGTSVRKDEGGSLRTRLEDTVFNPGREELGYGSLGEGETFGLDEGTSVLGDAIELVLEGCIQ
jgi:hypothetical protein